MLLKNDGGKIDLPRVEEKILEFWENNHIFQKSIEQRESGSSYSFYDGPPFATGLPHYGHILASTIKDSVTRFWTMRGRKVERRVGWDCHGLPVENIIEKELGLRDKKEVVELGIEKFNAACRAAVFRYVGNFENTLKRVGRWADYSNSYATLDNSYMESVWWIFKKLWEAGLVYTDYRVTPYCPRCGTPLSNFEVNQGYKDTDDPAVFIKFKLEDSGKVPTYFLAWTTTPWTLTANVALAVNPEFDYVKAKVSGESGEEILILAKDLIPKVLPADHEILEEVKGRDLLGIKYEPIFNFIKPDGKAHIVIPADFVTLEDGTGIVHTAGLFGADDMEACRKNGIAMVLTVNEGGKFVDAVTPWKGMFVKKADPEIINHLKEKGFLFKDERIVHSYPFCWRCDTPLLYYPIDSWYVAVTKIKENLLQNNAKIRWVPDHIKNGRFGKWLEDARDWSVSRNRFWGSPLPIWKCDDCGDHQAIESLSNLSERKIASGNVYYIMRHAEANSNVLNVSSSTPEKFDNDLTSAGLADAERVARDLSKVGVDVIFSSPLKRVRRTAEIVAAETGARVVVDERLQEYNVGVWNGEPAESFDEFMGSHEAKFTKAPEGGETLSAVRGRLVEFVKELEETHKNEKILIVGHGDPLWALETALNGLGDEDAARMKEVSYIQPGEWREVKWSNFPYDREGRVDLHRPFIDGVEIKCEKCGGRSKRIEHVFDCWFESGSMPYASWHYPFNNKEKVEGIFPADFIAEGLDQTRGWFYTLHVLATALTIKNVGLGLNNPAFKNVIVNGLILAEDGKKLSKKLKNYTDPEVIFEKFGADALRYFLLSSTAIGDDYRFSDKGVAEVKTKVIDRLVNSFNFYRMYVPENLSGHGEVKESVLDRWIRARLDETVVVMTEKMESYQLTDATRALAKFIDDLSNWYIRRSRKRLQRSDRADDYIAATSTLKEMLLAATKLISPFSPFISEAIYLNLAEGKGSESVHLEDWPNPSRESLSSEDGELIADMEMIREASAAALARREEAGIKVKQPLRSYAFNRKELEGKEGLFTILADEINVKQILISAEVAEGGVLDTEITPELRAEGYLREFTRSVQDMRQKAGLRPGEEIILHVETSGMPKNAILNNEGEIGKALSLKRIEYAKDDDVIISNETEEDGIKVWVGLKR